MSTSAGGTPPSTSPRLRAVSVAASGAGPPGRGRKSSNPPLSAGGVFSYVIGGGSGSGSVSPRSGGWAASSACGRHRGALLTALLLGIVALNFAVPAQRASGASHAAILAEQLLLQQAQLPPRGPQGAAPDAADASTTAGRPAHEAQPPAVLDGAAAARTPARNNVIGSTSRLRSSAQAAQMDSSVTTRTDVAAARDTTDTDRHTQSLPHVPTTSSTAAHDSQSDSKKDSNTKNGDVKLYEGTSKTGTEHDSATNTDRHSPPSLTKSADAADHTQTLQGNSNAATAVVPAAAAAATPSPAARPDAIVTLVAGNNAARAAVALVQSLRDVGTRDSIRIVVMLQRGGVGSPECLNTTWKREQRREHISCTGPDTRPDEIVSPRYLAALERLRAETVVTDEIPRTEYTTRISGGRHTSWGMSLNKMQTFNWTHYRKIVFMDSDTLAFQNIDHLFGPEYPTFTAALTFSCCNKLGPAYPSGGFWVFEPDVSLGIKAWEYMMQGKPVLNRDGSHALDPATGKPQYTDWYLSDLDIVKAMFTTPFTNLDAERYFPLVNDARHGYVPGLRAMPQFRTVTDAVFADAVKDRSRTVLPEGFIDAAWNRTTHPVVWHALDVRYDQCIGMCECFEGRDLREEYITVHFSCIEIGLHKPSWYESHAEFMSDVYKFGLSCTRWYYVEKFFKLLAKAGISLDPPYWTGPPVPLDNATHDILVREWKAAAKAERGYR